MANISTASADDYRFCTSKAKVEVAILDHENEFSTNDLVMFAAFSLPVVVMFPPASAIWGVPVTYKVIAAVKAKNARQILAMYEEAANGGGRQSRKIYKKIKKAFPNSELTYEQFLAEIHKSDIDGSSCQGKIPSKKDVISIFETEV